MNDFVLINIEADKYSQNVNRSYKGFAEITASIGAIVNIVYLVFNTSSFIYSRTEFFNRLIRNSTYFNSKKQNFGILLKTKIEIKKKNEFSDEKAKKLEESKVNFSNTNLNNLETETKIIDNIKFQLNKKTKIETSVVNLKQNEMINERFDDFTLLKYNHEKNCFEMIIIAFCPFIKFCNSKIRRDVTFMDYSMKHYYKYTDFFRFFENFIELNILKKLLLNKEESEVLNILKMIIFVENNDLFGPIKEYKDIIKMNNKDNLKTQGSLEISQEKLSTYIHNAVSNKNRSVFDQNLLDHFNEFLIV